MGPERTDAPPSTPWADSHGHTGAGHGRRRQERLSRAATHTAWRTVNNLQKLLVRATANRLLAIRRITQKHQGNPTAGMEGMVSATPAARWQVLQEGLSLKGDTPRPGRRVSIPQDNGQHRPVGRATGKDRGMQAMGKAALEPAWAARFAATAYGFRPGRCTMEAVEAIQMTTPRHDGSPWVRDAAMRGCFDYAS